MTTEEALRERIRVLEQALRREADAARSVSCGAGDQWGELADRLDAALAGTARVDPIARAERLEKVVRLWLAWSEADAEDSPLVEMELGAHLATLSREALADDTARAEQALRDEED